MNRSWWTASRTWTAALLVALLLVVLAVVMARAIEQRREENLRQCYFTGVPAALCDA